MIAGCVVGGARPSTTSAPRSAKLALMALVEELSTRESWMSAAEAAQALGVHRTAINSMILAGRLPAKRVGPRWRVPAVAFEEFRASYTRPPNVPIPERDPDALPPVAERVLEWLYRWETATTAELAEVTDDHPGNLRKGTTILRARGLATKDGQRVWRLTPAGVAEARRRGVALDV